MVLKEGKIADSWSARGRGMQCRPVRCVAVLSVQCCAVQCCALLCIVVALRKQQRPPEKGFESGRTRLTIDVMSLYLIAKDPGPDSAGCDALQPVLCWPEMRCSSTTNKSPRGVVGSGRIR